MRILLLFLLLSVLMDGAFSLDFSFVPIKKNWFDAQTYCRNFFTDLITINDLTENEEVLVASGNTSFWIGLHRRFYSWMWSDRSKVTFLNWAMAKNYFQYEICVLSEHGGWHNMSCSLENYFVCYGAPPTSAPTAPPTSAPTAPPTSAPTAPPTGKKTQILRLKVTSDEDVNDPEVKKRVLEKIQQILKMKGLDGSATLSWRNQSDGNVFQKYQEYNATQQICH